MLQSGLTGQALATLDGTRLTLWRTAAASALAARHLARRDAKNLLLVGAGALAPFLARAHASQRPIENIAVWNHRPEGAHRVAENLSASGFRAHAVGRLEDAVRAADIVSCATLSQVPLVAGAWLRARPAPRPRRRLHHAHARGRRRGAERARIFVDTGAALSEGGDVALGLANGAIARADVVADLAALAHGAPGRGGEHEITLFKSVGAAIEDLAAAMAVWKKAGGGKL